MKEHVHRHLLSELSLVTRTDTIMVASAVLFNTLVLFVNWVQGGDLASGYRDSPAIFITFLAGALLITGAAVSSLLNSKRTCEEFHESLMSLYEDADVLKYYPKRAITLGRRRFVLSMVIVVSTCLLAIGVPLIALFQL